MPWISCNPKGDELARVVLKVNAVVLPAHLSPSIPKITFVFEADAWDKVIRLAMNMLGQTQDSEDFEKYLTKEFLHSIGADEDNGPMAMLETMMSPPGPWVSTSYHFNSADQRYCASEKVSIASPDELRSAKAVGDLRSAMSDDDWRSLIFLATSKQHELEASNSIGLAIEL